MKKRLLTALASCVWGIVSQGAQYDMPHSSPPKPAFTSQPLPDPSLWADTPIEWSSSAKEFAQWITNNQTGEVTMQTHRVIAVGNGMNYIDPNGSWQQSQDVIELTADGGAAALRLPNKAFFGPTLSPTNAIKLVTMSNLVFSTAPIGVYFYDPTSGKEQILASLQNGVAGKLLPPNRIIYPNAFQSDVLQADLRITVTKGAMECDTIITHQPKASPQTFSMDPSNTLLQVRHVWTTPVSPIVTARQTAVAGLADSRIDFGDFRFVRGRAFAWDGAASGDTNTPAQIDFANANPDEPVGKEWQNASPSVLTESVLWADVQTKLAQLPLMAKADKKSKLSKQIELASSSDRISPGFVLDYITVTGTGDYTFNTYSSASANTYWLQSSASFGGVVTFNAGCIIKRAPGTTLTAGGGTSGDLVCNGTCSAPSIITVQDDNMYGEVTGTNCAATDTGTALVNEVRGASVSGMNIRYAGEGVEFYGECCPNFQTFSNSTLEACNVGLFANGCGVTITNSAISSVSTPTSTYNSGSFSGSWGSTCNQVSLHGVVVAGMQNLLSGKTPSTTTLQMYTYDTNGFATNYNTNCWIYGLKGLTSISVSNSSGGLQGLQLGAVLITSKHLLTATHIGFGPSNVFRFIGKSGTNYIGVVTDAKTIKSVNLGDVAVLTLDRDLPTNDVDTIRILPDGAINKMTFDVRTGDQRPPNRNKCLAVNLPCVAIDQEKGAYTEDLYLWSPSGIVNNVQASLWFPSWMNGYEPEGGDSGHPIMAVINNELVLVGNWSQQDYVQPSGPAASLSTITGNGYNAWFGFAFSSTNTLVIDGAWRYNVNTNPYTCNQTHTLAFFNSVGTSLRSVPVTALQSNFSWASSNLNTTLVLPGAANTNYYLLSQEFLGGDHWYNYQGTTNWYYYFNSLTLNTSDYFVSGAASSVNLGVFNIYTNSIGETFGPLAFEYYVYPHSGRITVPGSNTNAINQYLTNSGPQYSAQLLDISKFPNNVR